MERAGFVDVKEQVFKVFGLPSIMAIICDDPDAYRSRLVNGRMIRMEGYWKVVAISIDLWAGRIQPPAVYSNVRVDEGGDRCLSGLCARGTATGESAAIFFFPYYHRPEAQGVCPGWVTAYTSSRLVMASC